MGLVISVMLCPICLNLGLEDGVEDLSPPDSCMPCCKGHIHLACFMHWHALGQQQIMIRGPTQHGSKPIAMQTCRMCVFCRKPRGTARGPARVRPFEQYSESVLLMCSVLIEI